MRTFFLLRYRRKTPFGPIFQNFRGGPPDPRTGDAWHVRIGLCLPRPKSGSAPLILGRSTTPTGGAAFFCKHIEAIYCRLYLTSNSDRSINWKNNRNFATLPSINTIFVYVRVDLSLSGGRCFSLYFALVDWLYWRSHFRKISVLIHYHTRIPDEPPELKFRTTNRRYSVAFLFRIFRRKHIETWPKSSKGRWRWQFWASGWYSCWLWSLWIWESRWRSRWKRWER